jgi:hypothetical protein
MTQNMAEEEFNFFCEQATLLGLSVSPVKRSLRFVKDEETEREYMAMYYQRAIVEGTAESIEHLKAVFDKRLPPVFAELVRRST